MSKTSLFDLGPERLNRLLSIGKEDLDASDDPKAEPSAPTSDGKSLTGAPGSWIGRYRVNRMLGEGGMGIVHLAEQAQPIRRQVALKVIKPGMDSARVIARFEAERQTLALFDHPNIAHVLDAGITDNGLPYFVMEYVNGLSLTEHCDRHKLCIEDRLTLFLQVCSAIQYAHQKGIIHRDIKPSNILVSMQDEEVVPRIIDFGVARAMSEPLGERPFQTEQGQLLGTPEFMSPEQAQIESGDIDTRSDIYSLGVLLYALLTGALPFDSAILRGGGIDHIRQVIRETNPKTPSTQLMSLGEDAKKVAQNRRTEVTALAKKLHKELEWIPLKAMRKERSERYRSVSELADDIENYLKGEALIAGPLSTVYRLKKFVRRNRMLVTSVAAILAVLIAGVVVSTIFAIRAERQAKITQAVNDFLNNHVLSFLDIYRREEGEITALSILEAASVELEGKFKNEPLIEASIRQKLGHTYANFAQFDAARLHLERALQIRQEQLGEDELATIDSVFSLGYMLTRQGRYKEAEPFYLKALQSRRLVLGPVHSETLYTMHHLGLLYMFQGRYLDWEPLSLELLETSQQTLDDEHPRAILAISNTGRLYGFQGHYSRAEALLVKTLDLSRRIKGEEHAWTQEFTGWLGWLYHLQGRYAKAQPLLEKSVEMCRRTRVVGDDVLMRFENFLGALYIDQGHYDKAKELLSKAMETGALKLGQEHPQTLTAINGLGVVYIKQERYEEAETLLGQALKGRKLKLGEDNPETLETINDLGILRREQGQHDEAEKLLTEARDKRQTTLGPDHPYTLESMHELAMLYKQQACYDDAEQLLLEAVEGRRLRLGDTHPHTLESWNNLIDFYEAWSKPEKANQWRAKLPKEH